MKILVVDDTRIILSVIEAILSQDHQAVFTAENGRAGYAAFYDILPDIVITDILAGRAFHDAVDPADPS
jgi:DNA-binding response OmpR family regulator